MNTAAQPPRGDAAERRDYYERIRPLHLTPLWEALHALVPREPQTPCVPALWRYDEIRPLLMESAALITAEEAVRRVLVLENPALPGPLVDHAVALRRAAADHAGRGGAIAPPRAVGAALHRRRQGRLHHGGRRAHHHVPGRLHHHAVVGLARPWQRGHRGRERAGGVARRPRHPDGALLRCRLCRERRRRACSRWRGPRATAWRASATTWCRCGTTTPRRPRRSSAIPTRAAARRWPQLQSSEAPDAWQGHKLRYINPLTGGSPMPTIATFLQLLPKGFAGKAHRSTDGSGLQRGRRPRHGRRSAAQRFDFGPRDTFVVPSWAPLRAVGQRRRRAVQLFRPPGAAGAWACCAKPFSTTPDACIRFLRITCPSRQEPHVLRRFPAGRGRPSHRRLRPSCSRCAASTASAATTRRMRARWASTRTASRPSSSASRTTTRRSSRCRRARRSRIPYPAQHRQLPLRGRAGGADRQGRPRHRRSTDAAEHIYGYAVGLDMTRRDLQIKMREQGRPWEIGKAFDYSAPDRRRCTAAPTWARCSAGAITLEVDGKMRQSSDLQQPDLVGERGHRQPLDAVRAAARRPDLHRHARRRGRGAARRDHEVRIDGLTPISVRID